MENYKYYVDLAIKTASGLREQLEGGNKIYREGLQQCSSGQVSNWEVRTPVYDPINNQNTHNLITLVAEICEKKVTIDYPTHEAEVVNAYIKNYKDKNGDDCARVVVSKFNFCKTRFLICKELLHLFLYDKDSATVSIGDLNKLISNLLDITDDREGIEGQYSVEQAAYFGAAELLIPTKIVGLLRDARTELETMPEFFGTANFEIAKKLGVPESLVEYRLTERVDSLFVDAING